MNRWVASLRCPCRAEILICTDWTPSSGFLRWLASGLKRALYQRCSWYELSCVFRLGAEEKNASVLPTLRAIVAAAKTLFNMAARGETNVASLNLGIYWTVPNRSLE